MSRRLPLLLVIITGFLAGSALACSVPVFRYAFEHWRPDAYLAVVFHRGELSEEQQALIDSLQPAAADGSTAANLKVETVDLDAETDEAVTALWEEQEWEEQATETLPWVVVKAPPGHGPPPTVWSGALTQQNMVRLLTSPARKELQDRLLDGDSVVWMFLESGNAAVDDAAYETLQAEIKRLEQVLELPEIEEVDLKDLSLDPQALKLKMSAMRISRDDPEEQMLADMLLHVEPDLMDEPFVSQPMAFPVFGRGRALYALVGDGIVPGTIEEAGRFLTGACQCTVKAQNPGVDLLLAVDWDHYIEPLLPTDTTAPTLAGLAGFAEPELASATASIENETSDTKPDDPGDEATGATDVGSANPEDASASGKASRGSAQGEAVGPVEVADASAETDPAKRQQPLAEAASPPSVAGKVVLVMGLLAMCVVVATMVLIPRSR